MPIVISDDDDEGLDNGVFSSRERVAQAASVAASVAPAAAAQRVSLSAVGEAMHQSPAKGKAAPKAKPALQPWPGKPAKRKRVSEATLNGWRDNCACDDPDVEFENCNCQRYRDFLEWEKKCTCSVMYMNFCRCGVRKEQLKK
jgi:hypothetical protein